MSMRIKFGYIIERHQMEMNMWHSETFDGNPYPFSIRSLS